MNSNSSGQGLSINSVMDKVLGRLFPFLIVSSWCILVVSLVRARAIGIHPLLILHICFVIVVTVLYVRRRRLKSATIMWTLAGVFSGLMIASVATFGLLSPSIILPPMISALLLILGHRSAAFATIGIAMAFLVLMACLFISGVLASPIDPALYARSVSGWGLLIFAVGAASIAYAALFDIIPGAIRETDERFRVAFQSAGIGVSILNPEGKFLNANAALCAILGYTEDELKQKTFLDVTVPEDISSSLELQRMAFTTAAAPRALEKRYVHRDGHTVWVNVSTALVRTADGNPLYFITIINDITEAKEAEAQLRLLKHSIDVHFDGAYWHDTDFRFVYANDTGARALGMTKEELIGKPLSAVNPAATPEVLAHVWEVLREKRHFSSETVHRRKDGTEFPVEITTSIVEYNGKEFACGFARDITERKIAEETLRRSELQYRTLFERANDAIIIFRPSDEEILEANPVACEVYGHPKEEFVGMSLRSMTRDVDEGTSLIARLLDTGSIRDFPTVHIRKDGTPIHFLMNASVIDYQGGKAILSIGRDMTDREHAEQVRKKLEEQLYQTQKIESIGTLAAGIAHDFNNLLNIILGNASLMAQAGDLSEPGKRRAKAILYATERGGQLVRQLLTFARKAEVKRDTVKLNDVVRETARLLQETFPRTIDISLSLLPRLPCIHGDPTQVNQVIVNLAVNSRDAMPHGGQLVVSTDVVDGRVLREKFGAAIDSQYVVLSVADTGTGIDEATRLRMFDPFFTTKGAGKGTGLGLAVVHGIVTNHHGFIDVESSLRQGTRFIVYFPAGGVPGSEDVSAVTAEPLETRGTETILLAEDEDLARDLVAEVLREQGYTVIPCADGEEAIRSYEARQADIHLVISDIGLPRRDGEEVCRSVKRLNPAAPVLIVSGYLDPARRAALAEIGVTHVLQKPYQLTDLLVLARRTLDAARLHNRKLTTPPGAGFTGDDTPA